MVRWSVSANPFRAGPGVRNLTVAGFTASDRSLAHPTNPVARTSGAPSVCGVRREGRRFVAAAAGEPMNWSVEQLGDRVVGKPVGRVDEATWEAFSEALIAAVRQAKQAAAPLVVDLTGLDYMSSRGLRALTLASREAAGAVAIVLAAPNDRMREILAISRYDKMFKVVDSVAAAV